MVFYRNNDDVCYQWLQSADHPMNTETTDYASTALRLRMMVDSRWWHHLLQLWLKNVITAANVVSRPADGLHEFIIFATFLSHFSSDNAKQLCTWCSWIGNWNWIDLSCDGRDLINVSIFVFFFLGDFIHFSVCIFIWILQWVATTASKMANNQRSGGIQRPNGATQSKICQFKLVLLGESAVGKSSLVLRFVKGQFHEYQESTIGAAFLTQTVHIDDTAVKFEIWVSSARWQSICETDRSSF